LSSWPWNLVEQTGMQASALWRYPGIALWDTRTTENTVISANVIHLPLAG